MANYKAARSLQTAVDVTGNKTLAAADSGIVQNVTATCTVTLPAAAAGLQFRVRNGGEGTVTITIATNGTDTVTGNGLTPTTSKGIVNTLGTNEDEVNLVAVSGTWYITDLFGTWTTQA